MKLAKSTDWSAIQQKLLSQTFSNVKSNVHSAQVRKMICNINRSVQELSKEEVLERRRSSNKAKLVLVNINSDIETIEEFILMGALLGNI